jgi:adenylate cyclase class 2
LSGNDQELEVKYYITDLQALEDRLKELGARLAQAHVFESNLRFDTPEGDLTRNYQVLRLRQDTEARLTYKGPARTQDGVRVRQEIEFTASDFNAARALLEALGYTVSMMYEKYRTTYELDGVLVTLDEMPYGDFAEIEGPNPERILAVNRRLGLDWEARIPDSYSSLFGKLRSVLDLGFRDLSFENFKDIKVYPRDLGVKAADKS